MQRRDGVADEVDHLDGARGERPCRRPDVEREHRPARSIPTPPADVGASADGGAPPLGRAAAPGRPASAGRPRAPGARRPPIEEARPPCGRRRRRRRRGAAPAGLISSVDSRRVEATVGRTWRRGRPPRRGSRRAIDGRPVRGRAGARPEHFLVLVWHCAEFGEERVKPELMREIARRRGFRNWSRPQNCAALHAFDPAASSRRSRRSAPTSRRRGERARRPKPRTVPSSSVCGDGSGRVVSDGANSSSFTRCGCTTCST